VETARGKLVTLLKHSPVHRKHFNGLERDIFISNFVKIVEVKGA
jgi:hypothetical protein